MKDIKETFLDSAVNKNNVSDLAALVGVGMSHPRIFNPLGVPITILDSQFRVGDEFVAKGAVLRVAYVGKETMTVELVGPIIIGQEGGNER